MTKVKVKSKSEQVANSKVKVEAKLDDASRGRGYSKMRIFDGTLSLADWTTFPLSTFSPLCEQCAKVCMMC